MVCQSEQQRLLLASYNRRTGWCSAPLGRCRWKKKTDCFKFCCYGDTMLKEHSWCSAPLGRCRWKKKTDCVKFCCYGDIMLKEYPRKNTPDSKVHGANMEPIWGRQDPGGRHVGPMNFAIWGTVDILPHEGDNTERKYNGWCSATMLTCCWKEKIFQLMFSSTKEMLLKYWYIFVLSRLSSTYCFVQNRMNNILQTFPMCFIEWKCLKLLQYFIEMCFPGPKRLYKAITSTNVNLHLWWHMVSLGCNNK